MTDDRIHPAITIGSARRGRFAPTVVTWFAGQAEQHGDMTVDVIDLAEAGLTDALDDSAGDPAPEVVLDSLAWWGVTLREDRAKRPYAA